MRSTDVPVDTARWRRRPAQPADGRWRRLSGAKAAVGFFGNVAGRHREARRRSHRPRPAPRRRAPAPAAASRRVGYLLVGLAQSSVSPSKAAMSSPLTRSIRHPSIVVVGSSPSRRTWNETSAGASRFFRSSLSTTNSSSEVGRRSGRRSGCRASQRAGSAASRAPHSPSRRLKLGVVGELGVPAEELRRRRVVREAFFFFARAGDASSPSSACRLCSSRPSRARGGAGVARGGRAGASACPSGGCGAATAASRRRGGAAADPTTRLRRERRLRSLGSSHFQSRRRHPRGRRTCRGSAAAGSRCRVQRSHSEDAAPSGR